MILETRFT